MFPLRAHLTGECKFGDTYSYSKSFRLIAQNAILKKLRFLELMGESVKPYRLSMLLIFLSFVYMPLACASPILHITAGTDKSSYFQVETVRVYGKVTLGENPLRGSLVASEVRNENGHIVAAGTSQTNEKGLFTFAFKLSSNSTSQNYVTYVSARWENQTAVNCATFSVEASGSTEYRESPGSQEIPSGTIILVLLVLFGIPLLSILIISIFLFLRLKEIKVEIEPHASPQTQIDQKYKACMNCGKNFLRIRTFCPYCLAYHGQNGVEKAW